MHPDPIVIVARPERRWAFQGELKGFAAPSSARSDPRAVERARISPEEVQEVIMGCVLPQGRPAPARQARSRRSALAAAARQ